MVRRVVSCGLWGLVLVASAGMPVLAQEAQATAPAAEPGPAAAPSDPANPAPATPLLEDDGNTEDPAKRNTGTSQAAAPGASAPAATQAPAAAPAPSSATPSASSTATAPPPAPPAAPPAPPPSPFPLSFMLMQYHYVGEGNFAWNPYVRNPSLSSWYSIRGRVRLPHQFALSLRQDVNWEYTKQDFDTFTTRPLLADTRLGVSYGGFRFPEYGLGFSLFAGTRVPISLESRFRRQYGTADLVGGFDWSRWGIITSVAFIASMAFRDPNKPTLGGSDPLSQWFGDNNQADGFINSAGQNMGAQKCIARAAEVAAGGCPAVGAMNGNMGSFISFATVGYDLSAQLHLPVSVTATLATVSAVSSYFGPNDNLRAPDGRVGLGANHFTWGLVQASWQINDWLSMDVGTSSFQPLMNDTNQYPRFPFWNVPYWDLRRAGSYTGANNFSSLLIGFTTTAPW